MDSVAKNVRPSQSSFVPQVDLIIQSVLLDVANRSITTTISVAPKGSDSADSTLVTFSSADYRDPDISTAGSFWLPRDTKWDGGPDLEERAQEIRSRAQLLGELVTTHLMNLGDEFPYSD